MTTSNAELTPRGKNFHMAYLAAELRRHEDMVRFILNTAESVTSSAELSSPERKLLFAAVKLFLNDHCEAWHEVKSKTLNWVGDQSKIANFYLKNTKEKIFKFIREIKFLINRRLIPADPTAEGKVFYITLDGDLSCYMANLDRDEGEDTEALLAYEDAKGRAKIWLPWLSPARLMVALHLSVFYYEFRNRPNKAVRVAAKALNNAIAAGSNSTGGEFTKESEALILKLHNNIMKWTKAEVDRSPESVKEVGNSNSLAASPSEPVSSTILMPPPPEPILHTILMPPPPTRLSQSNDCCHPPLKNKRVRISLFQTEASQPQLTKPNEKAGSSETLADPPP